MPKGIDEYLTYLRKSRKDIDAERHGAGETLARHEHELIALSKRLNLNVTAVYKEIVSGETIAARPMMQQLLSEVEAGQWAGVLVMEVERLARGDTKDQGIVAEAFKFSNTKIITPLKTYDPSNEYDEEYFEFGLFMSRREFKTINRRIQGGRIASVKEGKYIAGTAPYGYRKVRIKNDKGFTLEIIPEEAEVVRMIFQLYTAGNPCTGKSMGMTLICRYLDSLGIKPRVNATWSRATIKDIITNPTYSGKVRWQWRKVVKQVTNGIMEQHRHKDKDCMLYNGLHDAIITDALFNKAQEITKNKKPIPLRPNDVLLNPLTGLIMCRKCGKLMTRAASNTKVNYPVLRCPNPYCDNISAPVYLIEDTLMKALKKWVNGYQLTFHVSDAENLESFLSAQAAAIKKRKDKLALLQKQLASTFDLLEQGVYDMQTFTDRNRSITDQINNAQSEQTNMQNAYDIFLESEAARKDSIPEVQNVIDVYDTLESAESKNMLLKGILNHVLYLKTERNKKGDRDNANFELTLLPKLPHR